LAGGPNCTDHASNQLSLRPAPPPMLHKISERYKFLAQTASVWQRATVHQALHDNLRRYLVCVVVCVPRLTTCPCSRWPLALLPIDQRGEPQTSGTPIRRERRREGHLRRPQTICAGLVGTRRHPVGAWTVRPATRPAKVYPRKLVSEPIPQASWA